MPKTITLYRSNGETAEIDAVDARRTLREHPSEWSASPFADGKPTRYVPISQEDPTHMPIGRNDDAS